MENKLKKIKKQNLKTQEFIEDVKFKISIRNFIKVFLKKEKAKRKLVKKERRKQFYYKQKIKLNKIRKITDKYDRWIL